MPIKTNNTAIDPEEALVELIHAKWGTNPYYLAMAMHSAIEAQDSGVPIQDIWAYVQREMSEV